MPHLSLIAGSRSEDSSRDDDADAQLLQRIAAGERSALETLYRVYHRRIDRFLARISRRADVVEEAINDTFWIVWQQAAGFRGESRASTWIMGIAYRCALKTLRRRGEEVQDHAEDDLAAGPDTGAEHELKDWVGKALHRLSNDQRVTLELAYGAGHTLEEIAAIMSCQVSTVKARMFHARVKLRHLLPLLAGCTPAEESHEQAR